MGISRQTVYKWVRLRRAEGLAVLRRLINRACTHYRWPTRSSIQRLRQRSIAGRP
ncbi:helix-turn-helix domain-containing protein [Geodermatophilus obscurus]|uniref:helix-turn-helix domain-containing protein n=1 Tax=Geodermatophilus obscurus TaxID=1861 RepID=UPI003C7A1103